MITIPQSTAHLVVFKAFLSSDHVSEATGKTIAITISKNGGAFGNPAAGALNATEISGGWYKAALGTTDTGTLGPVAIRGAVATIDDVGLWVQVIAPLATAAAVDDLPTNAELATALGTADDAVLGVLATLSGTVATVGGDVTAVLADTATIISDIGTAQGDLTSLLADTVTIITGVDALPTNAELATALAAADDATLAAVTALNNLSASQVNAEVVDALSTDTYAEPGQAAPGATIALSAKINYLYKAWRNRHTQTATEYNLYNDDATTVAQKASVSDDTVTFNRGEVASGP